MDKVGYSIQEAIGLTGIGRTKLYELLESGHLESVKVGRRRIIPASALPQLFERLAAEQRSATDDADSAGIQ